MMVAAQVQPRLHRRKHVIDGGFSRVAPERLTALLRLIDNDEWTRSLVRHQDIDATHPFARLDLLPDEMPALVVTWLMRQRCGRRCVPRRRISATEARDGQRSDRARRSIRDEMKVCDHVASSFPGGNPIEILVVALDPVQRR